MMQKIVEEIRGKLAPFTGGKKLDTSWYPAYMPEPGFGRFIRKIPPQNYEKLPKAVPISWL
ncbi:hypothetical protein HYW83_01115 [Candidatus Peregrinibacteria bacterium]|nr:hypothetical protein [Candidatus Peregrinibacteria bacterium]